MQISANSRRLWSCSSMMALLAGFIPANAAYAQDDGTRAPVRELASQQSDRASAEGDIIVTARRIEENLQDVPVAVTALSGADLRERQIESAADLIYNVPSLSVSPAVAGNSANYGLRGQRQGIGNTQGVVTYFAEVPVSASSTYRQTFDMASIQVLKGPQGTLFGANSNGGAILFVPQGPSKELEGEVQAAAGDYGLREFTAVLNLPIADGLAIRGAGNIVRRNGYTKNLNPCARAYTPAPGAGDRPPRALVISSGCGLNGAQDDVHHESWRFSVRAEPTDWLRNDLVYWGINEERIGASVIPYKLAGPFAVLFSDPVATLLGFPTRDSVLAAQEARGVRSVITDEQYYAYYEEGLSNITTVDFQGLTIKNIFGFRTSREDNFRDHDGSILPVNAQYSYAGPPRKTYTDELQVLGSLFDNRMKFVVGGYLSRVRYAGGNVIGYLYDFTPAQRATMTNLGLGALIFPNPATGRAPPVRTEDDTEALFANVDIEIAEGLRFSGGYRYTWNTAKSVAPQDLVNGVCQAQSNRNQSLDTATCSLIGVVKSNGYNYSATVQYDVADDTMVYVSTRRGYKPGGVNHFTVVDPNFFFFGPETITDYELGIKSQFNLGDVRVTANIAAFSGIYKGVQRSEVVQQANGAPAPTTFNAQKATIRGIEPELNFRFGRNLDLSLFYSYLDAKFNVYEIPGPGGTIIDKSGIPFSAVSKHSLGSTLVYRLPVAESIGAITVTANYYYRSRQTFVDGAVSGDAFVPGYGVANARLDWKLPETDITLSAAISNLFDKTYAIGGADYSASIVGFAHRSYGPPRMFRFEAAYRF
jgi:iron complex outermembrane receptor protein